MKNNPDPADILIIDRGLYKHYGVYIGDGKVIQYAGQTDDWDSDISIHETTLTRFAGGHDFIIGTFSESFCKTHTIFSPEETIARARSRLGERAYNLITNNCEHFALWCKLGVSYSQQVENAFAFCDSISPSLKDTLNEIYHELFGSNARLQALPNAPVKKVAFLSFEEVLRFFKQDAVAQKLSENNDMLAVVLKKETRIILCLYDKEKNTTDNNFIQYEPEKLDAALQELFGDKNMIILK